MQAESLISIPFPKDLQQLAGQRDSQVLQAAETDIILPVAVQRALALSDFVADNLCLHPEIFQQLYVRENLNEPRSRLHYDEILHTALADIDDETALMTVLRQVRRQEMVRIAWRDLAGLADLDSVFNEVSAFADAVVRHTLERLHAWQQKKLGEPRNSEGQPISLLVLALGKLGTRELNFSSDIDLIFVYPENGETHGGRRELSNSEFFIRLSRRLITVLNTTTEDGLVFRVDMRLRPFGESGPLAISFDALIDYYQTHGRDWERYMLLRARPMAGDVDGGWALLEQLRPFVYRRYLDFAALAALRKIKKIISQEVARKDMQDDVKLGPGGIRELEFVVQAFQVVRGGRIPELRRKSILELLPLLAELEYLPSHAVSELEQAYRFLRMSEHRIQEACDRQTHRLPDGSEQRLRLAAAMGFGSWPDFEHALNGHRVNVSTHFEQIFGEPVQAEEANVSQLEPLFRGDIDGQRAIEILREYGFDEAEPAWQALDKLLTSFNVRALPKRARRRLEQLLPLTLSAVCGHNNPVRTLERMLSVFEAISRRSSYLALLIERPLALSQLIRLCEASPRLAHQIGHHPLLLDELLDSRSLYAPLQRAALEQELQTQLGRIPADDMEQRLDCLRQFKQVNVLRVAAADVFHTTPLMIVSDHLTAIAEVLLEEILRLAWNDLERRYGRPRCRTADGLKTAGFAIIGYGKFGGIELGYSSDLDLVFLHSSEGEDQVTDGEKSIDNALFFGRLGQRIIHLLNAQTLTGRLYEVDTRLRPSGASGFLVSGIRAFEDYQREAAWTWEHQALVRARPITGDEALAKRFRQLRLEVLRYPREATKLRAEVCEMRERMRDNLSRAKAGFFDLKQDPGGIADIEFMVQYGALQWAESLGDKLRYTDNIRLLEGFSNLGLLTLADTALLTHAYRSFRAQAHALALQEQEAVVPAHNFEPLREGIKRIWDQLLGPDTSK